MLHSFLQHLVSEKHQSKHTVLAYKTDLTQFLTYLDTEYPTLLPADATYLVLRKWVIALSQRGLSNRSINRKIASLRAFYRFLHQRSYIPENPATKLDTLRTNKSLPIFLREKEVLGLLKEHPFEDSFRGWRDKLILELLYGTGIRLSELLGLRDADIYEQHYTIRVIGKRNKVRIIPFPKAVQPVVATYQAHRAREVGVIQDEWLLVTHTGKPCYPALVYRSVKRYLQAHTHADQHSPHVLRHTFATHLLYKGADLNAIKELLGHESLSATQIYTHHSLQKLQEVFKQAHPKA